MEKTAANRRGARSGQVLRALRRGHGASPGLEPGPQPSWGWDARPQVPRTGRRAQARGAAAQAQFGREGRPGRGPCPRAQPDAGGVVPSGPRPPPVPASVQTGRHWLEATPRNPTKDPGATSTAEGGLLRGDIPAGAQVPP